MDSAISVQDLRVRYRTKKGTWQEAVKGLSFNVNPGEVVGFLGPNGAGKSSTIKALMGFVQPTAGTASVFGLEAGSLEAKSRTGYLPEVALYYPYLTPFETLNLYGELEGLKGKALRTESETLLEAVGLKDAMRKQNRSLSKGMLQRVGIAQALLGNPELLILDEVTSGLDPVGRKELRTLLKDRQARGATLFFSSHELSEVDMLCDRILLIHEGKLVEEREMNQLKDELRNYVLTYVGKLPDQTLGEGWSVAPGQAFSKRFPTKAALMSALENVQASGGKLVDIVAEEGSLEDYFIETVRRAA
ncbi:MAG: type transport system ATP-binding protein [Fimbriimonadaceae bacterium]|jgi:ABC-2 type transport system ATP-binding protein|nr:type transport system ATP-binding protein [Fimbriimonadaceae bacterium]